LGRCGDARCGDRGVDRRDRPRHGGPRKALIRPCLVRIGGVPAVDTGTPLMSAGAGWFTIDCVSESTPYDSSARELRCDVVVVMGVSASGKSTVAAVVAQRLGWAHIDADDYHPQANIDKMSA